MVITNEVIFVMGATIIIALNNLHADNRQILLRLTGKKLSWFNFLTLLAEALLSCVLVVAIWLTIYGMVKK